MNYRSFWRASCLGNLTRILGALVLSALFAPAFAATLAWDANRESNLAGYKVYSGSQSRRYSTVTDVGRATSKTVEALQPGQTYCFAITAYCSNGLESGFSAEVTFTVPALGTNTYLVPFRVTFSRAASVPTIAFVGEAGHPCFVQASADLQAWQNICVFTPPTNGITQWADAEAPNHRTRFYRVIGSRP